MYEWVSYEHITDEHAWTWRSAPSLWWFSRKTHQPSNMYKCMYTCTDYSFNCYCFIELDHLTFIPKIPSKFDFSLHFHRFDSRNIGLESKSRIKSNMCCIWLLYKLNRIKSELYQKDELLANNFVQKNLVNHRDCTLMCMNLKFVKWSMDWNFWQFRWNSRLNGNTPLWEVASSYHLYILYFKLM